VPVLVGETIVCAFEIEGMIEANMNSASKFFEDKNFLIKWCLDVKEFEALAGRGVCTTNLNYSDMYKKYKMMDQVAGS
jgi:hypothetical protein